MIRSLWDAAADPAAFDGEPQRAYNVVPNALLVNYKAIRYQFGDSSGREWSADRRRPDARQSETRESTAAGGGALPWLPGGGRHGRSRRRCQPIPWVFTGDFPAAMRAPIPSLRTALRHDTFVYGVFTSLWRELGGRHTGEGRRAAVSGDLAPAMVWRSPLTGRGHSQDQQEQQQRDDAPNCFYTLGLEASASPGYPRGVVSKPSAATSGNGV